MQAERRSGAATGGLQLGTTLVQYLMIGDIREAEGAQQHRVLLLDIFSRVGGCKGNAGG